MRRRATSADRSGLPRRLAVFVEADWPGAHHADKYGAWMRARHEWAEANGVESHELLGEQEAWAAFPDAPFDPDSV